MQVVDVENKGNFFNTTHFLDVAEPKNIKDLVFMPQKRSLKNRHKTIKEIVGWDTETLDGYANLITNSDGLALNHLQENKNGFDLFLKTLFSGDYHKKFNFFYNLKFDSTVILKFLKKNLLVELYKTGRLTIKHKEHYANRDFLHFYHLTLLPEKRLTISLMKFQDARSKPERTIIFHDIAQFFHSTLNDATWFHLNKEKLKQDVTKNTIQDFYSKDFIDYGKYDAILTKEISQKFLNEYCLKPFDYQPRHVLSTGNLAKEYFKMKCYIPTIEKIPKEILQYAYASYQAGRFENLMRGTFGEIISTHEIKKIIKNPFGATKEKTYMVGKEIKNGCWSYDLCGAYSFAMLHVIDANLGEWLKVTDFKKDAYYGFYKIRILQTNPHTLIPIKLKSSRIIYPIGYIERTITQKELEIMINLPETHIEIIDGWVFYPTIKQFFLKDAILELFNERKKMLEENNPMELTYKILLNSLYGAFYETNINNITKNTETGTLWNSIIASYITSFTRCQIYEFAVKHRWENVISFATDCITFNKDLHISSPKPKDKILGNFELQSQGCGLFLMSGIYSIVQENKPTYIKFRGGKKNNLFNLLKKQSTDIKIKCNYFKPCQIGEMITQINKKSFAQLGTFINTEKTLNINADKKRSWHKNFKSGYDALHTQHTSKPWELSPLNY